MTKSEALHFNISRRAFLYGTGAVAATAALSALGCTPTIENTSTGISVSNVDSRVADSASMAKLAGVDTIDTQIGSVAVLSVADDNVFTTEDCKLIKKRSTALKRVARAHLPYGTLLWANDDKLAACLLPCDTSDPLTQIALLSLSTGDLHTVRKSAVSKAEGFHIYDVRANSQGAIWLEANILEGRWRIYTAPISSNGTQLGEASLADEGDGAWETPSLAVAGDFGFWQLSPSPNNPDKDLTSMLMRVKFGDNEENAKCVYEAPGRMACAPASSEGGIAIAPRAALESGSGVYYQLTYINADSGVVESALALPSSMKPNYVAYGPSGFSFSFESIYNYGDGISNLGTYVATGKNAIVYANDMSDAASNGGSADGSGPFGEWFRFPRSPFTEPAWMNNWFVVKSTSVVAGIDLSSRRYFSIDPEYALQGYGEYLASEGTLDRIVTYANIDYTPVGGDHIRECNVRIWESA